MSYRLYTIYCEKEKLLNNRGNSSVLPHNTVPRFSFSLFEVHPFFLMKDDFP